MAFTLPERLCLCSLYSRILSSSPDQNFPQGSIYEGLMRVKLFRESIHEATTLLCIWARNHDCKAVNIAPDEYEVIYAPNMLLELDMLGQVPVPGLDINSFNDIRTLIETHGDRDIAVALQDVYDKASASACSTQDLIHKVESHLGYILGMMESLNDGTWIRYLDSTYRDSPTTVHSVMIANTLCRLVRQLFDFRPDIDALLYPEFGFQSNEPLSVHDNHHPDHRDYPSSAVSPRTKRPVRPLSPSPQVSPRTKHPLPSLSPFHQSDQVFRTARESRNTSPRATSIVNGQVHDVERVTDTQLSGARVVDTCDQLQDDYNNLIDGLGINGSTAEASLSKTPAQDATLSNHQTARYPPSPPGNKHQQPNLPAPTHAICKECQNKSILIRQARELNLAIEAGDASPRHSRCTGSPRKSSLLGHPTVIDKEQNETICSGDEGSKMRKESAGYASCSDVGAKVIGKNMSNKKIGKLPMRTPPQLSTPPTIHISPPLLCSDHKDKLINNKKRPLPSNIPATCGPCHLPTFQPPTPLRVPSSSPSNPSRASSPPIPFPPFMLTAMQPLSPSHPSPSPSAHPHPVPAPPLAPTVISAPPSPFPLLPPALLDNSYNNITPHFIYKSRGTGMSSPTDGCYQDLLVAEIRYAVPSDHLPGQSRSDQGSDYYADERRGPDRDEKEEDGAGDKEMKRGQWQNKAKKERKKKILVSIPLLGCKVTGGGLFIRGLRYPGEEGVADETAGGK